MSPAHSPFVVNEVGLSQLQALAQKLASFLVAGDFLALVGDLGAGKTTFAQFFMEAKGIDRALVTSPTFTLVQMYTPLKGPPVWHVDLYRLKAPEEIEEIGLEEAPDQRISLVEWPSRLGPYSPREYLSLKLAFDPKEGSKRLCTFTPHGDHWNDRFSDLCHHLSPDAA